MGDPRALATWLVRSRRAIDAEVARRPGPGLPAARSAEAEALRRFRSFAALALLHGERAQPSLEGLRVSERRATALLEAWVDAASATAGPDGAAVRAALSPLAMRYRQALRSTASARRAGGAPRPGRRRAVSAAIDRLADIFLAVDTESGTIEDANPAAGALLGTTRDELLGRDAMSFVPEPDRGAWWTQLDAVAEGGEARRFRSALQDTHGNTIQVDASITRFATRRRTLALFVARVGSDTSAGPETT